MLPKTKQAGNTTVKPVTREWARKDMRVAYNDSDDSNPRWIWGTITEVIAGPPEDPDTPDTTDYDSARVTWDDGARTNTNLADLYMAWQ
jgi:hypothetical protein